MEQKTYFFAVDLGATSGRTIIGQIEDKAVKLEEITRFPNNLIEQGGHFYWDIYALYLEIIRGLKEVARRGLTLSSIGIDTWGVDYGYLDKTGTLLSNPYHYRDTRTDNIQSYVFEKLAPRREIYGTTGIQSLNFNTLYQIAADLLNK